MDRCYGHVMSPWRTPCGSHAPEIYARRDCYRAPGCGGRFTVYKLPYRAHLSTLLFPIASTDNGRRSSEIDGSAPPFEGRVPYVSVGVSPPACGKDRRRSRAVGDSAVSPPPSPGAALGSCSVPASRIAFRNACERVICRPHAHSRAPARAGPAPSRDRPVPAHPERQPGAHTRARAWCRCRWPLWRVPAET